MSSPIRPQGIQRLWPDRKPLIGRAGTGVAVERVRALVASARA